MLRGGGQHPLSSFFGCLLGRERAEHEPAPSPETFSKALLTIRRLLALQACPPGDVLKEMRRQRGLAVQWQPFADLWEIQTCGGGDMGGALMSRAVDTALRARYTLGTMSGRGALSGLGILMAACAGAASTASAPEAPPGGSIRIEIDGTAPVALEVGGFAHLRISISNVSDLAILILSVGFKFDFAEGPLELGRPVPGAVRLDATSGEYTYDPAAPQRTSEPLQEGLLLQGQTLIVRRAVRLLGAREEAVVRYLKLNPADLHGEIYFPEGETGLPARFRRPDEHALRLFLGCATRSPNLGGTAGPGSVLVSSRLLARPAQTASQVIEWPVRPPAVPWAEAMKRGRDRGRFLTYCTTLRGWIFESDEGHWLVSAGHDRPLPLAPPRLYRDLDLNGWFDLVADDAAAGRIGGIAGSKIEAGAAARVLEAIRAGGFRIERRAQGEDQWVYEVR